MIKKFGRKTDPRRALFKDLATALIEREKIVTTLTKAKAIRPVVERLITKGKLGTLAARRDIMTSVHGGIIADKVMKDLAPRYTGRNGGYTRIIKLGARVGDGAERARIEFV